MKYTSGQKIKMTGFRWGRYRGHKGRRESRASEDLKGSRGNRGHRGSGVNQDHRDRRVRTERLETRDRKVKPVQQDHRGRRGWTVNRARMEDITRLRWMPKEILALLAANLECRRSLEQTSEARRDRPGLVASQENRARKEKPVKPGHRGQRVQQQLSTA